MRINQTEPLELDKISIVSAGTTAKDIEVKNRSCVIQNQHDTQILYVSNKEYGAVTATTGYAIYPKETSLPLTAETLSIIASGATTTAAIVYFN